jgi:hypothetical protein
VIGIALAISLMAAGVALAQRSAHARTAITNRAAVYGVPPTVSRVSPASGPSSGGTTVTISGSGFLGASGVTFGGVSATGITVVNDNTIIATSPPGTGVVDVIVDSPTGNSAPSSADQFSYIATPTVTGVSPNSGPAAGGTSVTITGSGFTGATGVAFGGVPATGVTVLSDTTITATAPAGTGTVDVTVTGPAGTSATSASDHFTYNAATTPPGTGPGPGTGTGTGSGTGTASAPAITASSAVPKGSTAAALAGSVNPDGGSTVAHWEYGIDPSLRQDPNTPLYDQRTADQPLGSGTTPVLVVANLTGLVPHALYHARLVATSSLGASTGPDITFRTAKDPAPPAPVLGQSEDVTPVSGVVFVKLASGHGASDRSAQANLAKGNGFVPLTEARQIPLGSQIDSRRGTLRLITARPAKRKTQSGVFGGALFKATQTTAGPTKGLTTLALLENLFAGAPSFKGCPAGKLGKAPDANAAKARPNVLQTLHARDNHGRFRTKGRYSAGTVRGTIWDTSDQCNGTLTKVHRGTVDVLDFHRHKTITVHAGHSYLAKP